MINLGLLRRGWQLLERRERRNALILLSVVSLSALAAGAMVASIMPFLYVLSQPEIIHASPVLRTAYDTLGFTSDFAFLVALGLASLGVVLAAGILQVTRAWAVARFATMRMHSLSRRLLAAYLAQPYEFFLGRHTGNLSTQILAEAQQVVVQFFRPAAEAVAAGLTILAVVSLLIVVNPVVALLTFGAFGVAYGTIFLLSRRVLVRAAKRRLAANRERFKITGEALGGVKYIKLSGHERTYLARYDGPSLTFARTQVVAQLLAEVPQYAMMSIAFGGGIVFCLLLLDPAGVASGAALGGILPVVGVFAMAAMRVMPELARLYRAVVQIQGAGPAVNAIHTDLSRQGDPAPKVRPAPLRLTRDLTLEDVAYRYPGSEGTGISNVSLNLRSGEKIGIVGATGAGKTTLADVVLGLLTPQSGRMLVDGVPVGRDNMRAWQRSVGYVPQDIFLTDASVAENIAVGERPEAIDMARIQQAATAARIHGFVIDTMPDGYATRIGERGVRLSGGQRQRLGIARALYADADLIMFDEATSALDAITEREVIAAVDSLPGEKTVLMIAHRLSTLRVCDRIVVMKAGRVSAMGTWDALLAENSDFRAMAEMANAA